jgi:hypothetical protein
MNLQIDLLYNSLRTRPIQTGREMSRKLYPNRQFGFIDDRDCQSGLGSVLTRTRTRSDGPELLLTLVRFIDDLIQGVCKGTYALVWPDRHTYGNYRIQLQMWMRVRVDVDV